MSLGRLALVVAALLAVSAIAPAGSGVAFAAIVATTADDVCAPGVDPCIVDQVVQVVPGAVLDFGTRAIRMLIGGQFDVAAGNSQILCGPFLATLQGKLALKLKNAEVGGSLTLTVRGSCTGDRNLACLTERTCLDAGAGSCDASVADLVLVGRANGVAAAPGSIFLRSAGSITINDSINVSGTTIDSDGGMIDLSSFGGDITVSKTLTATGGAASVGGDVTIDSAGDVLITDVIDVSGGDFDGGTVDITASGDIHLHEDIKAGANAGAGFGGEVTVDAGGKLLIDGGTDRNRQVIVTNGNGPFEGSGGDGGSQCYDAVGDITVGEFVRLEANGAAPDGFGEEIDITSTEGSILLHGAIQSKARGGDGVGGTVGLDAADRVETFATAIVDVTGSGTSGTDEIFVFAEGDFVHAGVFDVSTGRMGSSGDIDVRSSGDVTVTGSMFSAGVGAVDGVSGSIVLAGCNVTLAPGALVSNAASLGRNVLSAREQLTIQSGATLSQSGSSGSNQLVYRLQTQPPILFGSISPPPSQSEDPELLVCPVCANGFVEPGESCDDSNLIDGDGCSSGCQDEACVAATPGFPTVSLCNDANGCTIDACDGVAHQCTHVPSCDDQIDCTIDACVGIVCRHTPSAALCEDGNPCTAHSCSTISGCNSGNIPGSCDDGVACTNGDSCVKGTCSGLPNCPAGQICSVAVDACVVATTTSTTSTTSTTAPTSTTSSTTSTTAPATTTTTVVVPGGCGDGVVQVGEECDRGVSNGVVGVECSKQCRFVDCGDPNGVTGITASDALFALQAAVGSVVCAPCVCDVASTGLAGAVTASDALVLLRVSVGIPIVLTCPVCP